MQEEAKVLDNAPLGDAPNVNKVQKVSSKVLKYYIGSLQKIAMYVLKGEVE